MSEAVTIKKRGRPKKVVVVEDKPAIEVENATPKKTTTRRKKSVIENEEPPVKAAAKPRSRAKASQAKVTAAVEAIESALKANEDHSRKSQKETEAAAKIGKGNNTPSQLHPGNKTSLSSSDTAQSDKGIHIVDSTGAKSQDNDQDNLNIAKKTISPEATVAGSSSIEGAIEHSQRLSTQAIQPEQHTSKVQPSTSEKPASIQTPTSSQTSQPIDTRQIPDPGPTSKILEALALQQSSSPSSNTVPFPSNLTASSASGPKFSASSPLNTPQMPRQSSTPSAEPPLDIPTGPPNPGQMPLTPRQISDLQGDSNPSPSTRPSSRLPASKNPFIPTSSIPLDAPTGPPNPGQLPLTPQHIEAIKSTQAYKSAQSRWTRLLIAAPIAIVTSYVLWDRYRRGDLAPKVRPTGSGPEGGLAPPILGGGSSLVGEGNGEKVRTRARPRVIGEEEIKGVKDLVKETVVKQESVGVMKEKRLLEL